MPPAKIAVLPDRGIVSVRGQDAAKLLQGLITNDIGLLETRPAIHAALLTPQGKILHDFFVVKAPEGFRLDVARDKAAGLAQRIAIYRLRADVTIEDVSPQYTVAVLWDGAAVPGKAGLPFPDPRLPALGVRDHVSLSSDWVLGESGAMAVAAEAWHAHRISLGVPEGGKDYVYGDTFPHEALFDRFGSVSFTKGCFVGQEVVSRMEHRGVCRKRIVRVSGGASLPPPGTEVRAGHAVIGIMGSSCGRQGLALIRLDRLAELRAAGEAPTAEDVPLDVELPEEVPGT